MCCHLISATLVQNALNECYHSHYHLFSLRLPLRYRSPLLRIHNLSSELAFSAQIHGTKQKQPPPNKQNRTKKLSSKSEWTEKEY